MEKEQAIQSLSSMITRCEKFQPKFNEGSSQHSLLKNRIKALQIAQTLLETSSAIEYSNQELEKALPPILSIHRKTSKARNKYEVGSTVYKRLTPTIEVMEYVLPLLEQEIEKRKQKNEK